MTAAERQASKSFNAIEKRAKAFGAALGVGLVTAATALTALTKSAIDNADALRDSSIQLGISTETLSAYSYAAQQTGTDLDSLSRGLKILSKNAADALKPTSEQARVFKALGISVTDATGQLKQLDELVPEVANAFAQLEDGTQKAALAQSLFGKSGLELTEFLNSGAKGLEDFSDKARELGIIVGTDTANAADEFNDKLADLKALVSGFGNQLAAELLPRLIELVDYFNKAAKEGTTLGTSVKDLGSIFDLFVGQVKQADDVGNSFQNMLALTRVTVDNLKSGLSDLLSLDIGSFIKKMVDARNSASLTLLAGFGFQGNAPPPRTSAGRTRRGGAAMNMTPGVNPIDEAALAAALAGIGGGGSKKGSSPKKAAQEVDKLDESYKRLAESMKEEIALFGETSEAAKLRYDLENGDLAKLAPAKKELLIAQAEQLDQMKLMAELQEAADKSSLRESERIKEGIEATDEVIDQLEFELSLIGQRNSEIEKAIALRHLDANATDEQRQRVSELTDELIRASENQQFLDDFKTGLSDAFVDFVSGAKSAKDAFGDFADELFKRALQFVADKAIEAMFDAFNGDGKIGGKDSAGGGWFSNLLGAFSSAFGGGRESGGTVMPGKFYRVNEAGMEMATVDGRDYLMTGAKSGMVTPANKMGGAVYNLNNTFMVPPGQRQRTQEQQAQKMGQQVEEITRRNS
jgi:hypothetical protein